MNFNLKDSQYKLPKKNQKLQKMSLGIRNDAREDKEGISKVSRSLWIY